MIRSMELAVPGLEPVSFFVGAQEHAHLVCPGAAGRARLLAALAGARAPLSGHVEACGADLSARGAVARGHIGYAPAGAVADPAMRVADWLLFLYRVREMPPADFSKRMEACLSLLEIADVRRAFIGALPLASRRRLGLAAALLHDPDVLIAEAEGIAPALFERVNEGRALLTAGPEAMPGKVNLRVREVAL